MIVLRLTYAWNVPQEKPNWEKAPPRDWGEEQAFGVAQEVRRLRGGRTAQWLADRTKDLGYPITRAVISDLEVGRRRYVTTAELIVLAMALETAPVALMYPAPYLDKIQLFPTLDSAGFPVEVTKLIAAQWFSGLASGVDADGTGQVMSLPLISAMNMNSNLRALQRARRIQLLDEQRIEKRAGLQDNNLETETVTKLMAQIAELTGVIDELRELGARDLTAERTEELFGQAKGSPDGG